MLITTFSWELLGSCRLIYSCSIALDTLFFSLSLVQYSVFGSILTIGGMAGAIASGRISDLFGHKVVSSLNIYVIKSLLRHQLMILVALMRQTFLISNTFYIMGWLAIVFSKVLYPHLSFYSFTPFFCIFLHHNPECCDDFWQEAWSLYLGRLSLGFGTAVFNYVVRLHLYLLSTVFNRLMLLVMRSGLMPSRDLFM